MHSRSSSLGLLIVALGAAGVAGASCGGDDGSTSGDTGPSGPTSATTSSSSSSGGGTTGDGGSTSDGGGGTSSTGGSTGEGGSSTSTGMGGGTNSTDTRTFFNNNVKPGLVGECIGCHDLGGAADSPFLAGPDVYSSIVTYPGIVVRVPSQSILETHPASPDHGGGLGSAPSPSLATAIDDWLTMEAALIPPPELSMYSVTPFKPKLGGAFNTVYLEELGDEFANVSITFTARELGSPVSMLLLENIEIHPISQMQLQVTHPLFSAYPADDGEPVPDPADNFSDIDDIFSITGQSVVGTGTMIHTGWTKNAYLGLGFERVELAGDFIPPTECKALPLFQTDVAPQLQVCAGNCHGGQNPLATGAMDLTTLNSDPFTACQQVRARVKRGFPDESQIVIVTNPQDPAVHLFKFQGSLSQYNTFKGKVGPWIVAEAESQP